MRKIALFFKKHCKNRYGLWTPPPDHNYVKTYSGSLIRFLLQTFY